MIDIGHLREHVIRPVLHYLGAYSQAAEELLVGTAIQESRATYLKQLGSGPALGIYQMEPATHRSLWDHYLAYRPELASKVRGLASQHWWIDADPAQEMAGNLYYATAMCRIKYKRIPKRLPHADDMRGLAEYWKLYYNTPAGRGTVDEFVRHYIEHA